MGLQINTNVTALNALRNLQNVSSAVSTSIHRLSSGLRINHASDDPAGLIISESLRAQIDGLNQAVSNSQDATNVIKTAEGGLNEIQNILIRMRELSMQSASDTVGDVERGFTNKEIAESMGLSEFTVKNHVHRIMRQLNADSRYAAVQTVCDQNLPATI
jgi:flagellin